MAEYGAELPEGITLDEPQAQPQEYGAELPQGITLDPSPVSAQPAQGGIATPDQPIMQDGDIDHANLNPKQQAAAGELVKRGRLKSIVAGGINYLRPTFEGLASAGAAIGGTALGGPLAGAVAAAGAYTGTKQGLDRLEEWATLPEDIKTAPPMQQMKQTMEDFRTGLTFEFGGPAAMEVLKHAGKGAAGGFGKIKDMVRKNTPALSENAISKRAGEIIQEHRGNLDQYDINLAESEKVSKAIPGFESTIGQKTGDPGLIKLQRGLETKPGVAAQLLDAQRTGNVESIQNYLKETFPGGATIDDVLTELETQGATLRTGREATETAAQATERAIPTETPQVTGQKITETIAEAQAPLKKIEKEYWDKVPNYEMAPTETEAVFNELSKEPSQAQKTVATYFEDYKNRPKTIKGLQTTEREINDVIFDPNANPTVKRALGKIKTAINKDFAELGEAAERGDFATVEGKVVHPKKLQEELVTVENRLLKEGAEKPPEPDYDLIFKELSDAKESGIMRQKGEDKKGWQRRIVNIYKNRMGKAQQVKTYTDAPIGDDTLTTGSPVNIKYAHNNESTPFMGDEFAQDIEPSGKYIAPNSGKYKIESPNMEYGTAEFQNPIVLEHKTTRHGGWKTDLSEMYNGKTGKTLTKAIKKDGYDGIITVDGNRISESVYIGDGAKKATKPKIAKQLPKKEAVMPPHIEALEKRAGLIKETLKNAEPAQNAAIAYANAKAFSKSQITDKFRKGVVAELEAQGTFQAGKKLPAEARPKKLMNVESADKFIDAVGKEKASDIMLRHYADDMATNVKYGKDGVLESASLSKWNRKHKKVLERYGIDKEFKTADEAHKAMQAARTAETEFNKSIASKMLNSDPQNAIQRAFEGGEGISGKNTGAIMRNLLKRVEGNPQAIKGLENGFKDFMYEQIKTTAETLKGDSTLSKATLDKAMKRFAPGQAILYKKQPEKLKALKTVQKALLIMNRTAKGVTGGSDTSEKLNIVASVLHSIARTPGIAHGVKLSQIGLGMLKNLNEQEVTDFTAKLLYDPDLAKIISKATGKNPPVNKIKTELKNYMERAAITAARDISKKQENK